MGIDLTPFKEYLQLSPKDKASFSVDLKTMESALNADSDHNGNLDDNEIINIPQDEFLKIEKASSDLQIALATFTCSELVKGFQNPTVQGVYWDKISSCTGQDYLNAIDRLIESGQMVRFARQISEQNPKLLTDIITRALEHNRGKLVEWSKDHEFEMALRVIQKGDLQFELLSKIFDSNNPDLQMFVVSLIPFLYSEMVNDLVKKCFRSIYPQIRIKAAQELVFGTFSNESLMVLFRDALSLSDPNLQLATFDYASNAFKKFKDDEKSYEDMLETAETCKNPRVVEKAYEKKAELFRLRHKSVIYYLNLSLEND